MAGLAWAGNTLEQANGLDRGDDPGAGYDEAAPDP